MRRVGFFLLLVLFLVPVGAYAAVGVSLEFGGGSGNFDNNYVDPGGDVDTGYTNIGFVYDSNPYGEKGNVAYRLNIALEGHNYEFDDGVTVETGALVFDNTLAFALARNGNTNFWIGPQLRLGFWSGETDTTFWGEPIEFSGSMFGIGALIGANVRLSEQMGMSVSAGLRQTGLGGEISWDGDDDDFTGRSTEGFVNLALLFN
jgi:hypothetical protein